MKELCFECQATGECWFEKEAKNVADLVTDIPESGRQQLDALVAHKIIAHDRIIAREKSCPNLNFDPDYNGKSLL
jgi:hypothetical protein